MAFENRRECCSAHLLNHPFCKEEACKAFRKLVQSGWEQKDIVSEKDFVAGLCMVENCSSRKILR